MREDIAGVGSESSRPTWEELEGWVREGAQEFIQGILEEEVTELLGREKSERRRAVDAVAGYRNGYGEQRCWNHKMRNVLDRLPQREQSEAKDLLRAVVYAPSRAEALKAREVFARRYRPWYPKAVDVLEDDWERMVAFYDFPEDHWKHLRTTNVVESPFAALRLRTTAAKRFKRVESATALIWKLLLVAEKRFRRLDAPHLLKDVFEGRKSEDGKPVSTQQRKNAA